MIFFVVFVFSAVMLGIGVMLAPILATVQPRVGLASTVALASTLITGVLWTTFIGWDTLIIDYVLFGLVSIVILGGTMIQAHDQSSDDNDEPEPSTQWMNRNDFILFVTLGGVCLVFLLFQNPQSNQQIEMTSVLQTGQNLETIGLEFPQITNFSVLGFHILSAYLSQQLQQDIAIAQSAVTSVLIFLAILTAYDLGIEAKDNQLGRILALIALVSLLIVAFFYAPILLGILLTLGILIFVLRLYHHRHWLDFVGLSILLISLVLI